MIYAAVMIIGLSFAWGAEDCPDLRAEGPLRTAAKVQTEARAGAGDPCPDKSATGSDAQQSELLELLRYRVDIHLQKMIAKTRRPDVPALRAKFLQMRAFLGLRHSLVRLDRGTLAVEPELQSSHADNFAPLDRFSPEDLKRMNAMIGARVARANSQFKNEGDKMAGKRLMDDLRALGSNGYEELVAHDPTLRYVKADLDIGAASNELRTELENGKDDLKKLTLNPPYGRGVGLIYATDVAAAAVQERPELCGAFNSLMTKARRMRRGVDALNASLLPLSAMCQTGAKLISWVSLVCGVAVAGASKAITYVPGADFKRVRLLYGTPFDPYQSIDEVADGAK